MPVMNKANKKCVGVNPNAVWESRNFLPTTPRVIGVHVPDVRARRWVCAASCFAALLGALSPAQGSLLVDADTVLYVDCDTNYGFGQNAATATDKFTSTHRGGDYLQTDGKVAAEIRDGVNGVDVANGGYLYSANGIAVEWQGASGYCSGDFTFECFIRLDADAAAGGLGGNYVVYHPQAWMIQFDADGKGVPSLKKPDWGSLGTSPSIKDGAWHHLAVVQDRARGKFRYYFDYRLVSEADYVVTPPENVDGYDYFRINNYSRNGEYNFIRVSKGVAYDEVRLTKRALAPEEFVTTPAFVESLKARQRKSAAMASGETLVYASCDAGLPTNDVNGDGKPALVLRMDGTASPAVGATGDLATVYPTGCLDAGGQKNSGCLELASCGRMVMADTSYLSDDFTLEFFLRCADASLLWKNDNDRDAYLVHQNSLFYMQMFTDGSVSCDGTSVLGLADGAWHHYAVTYEKAARALRYYIDHRLVKAKAFEQDLSELKTSDPLYLGAGSWGNGAWHCVRGVAYDEIRLTQKALPPAAFLAPRRWPVFEETKAYFSFADGADPTAARPALNPELGCTRWAGQALEKTSEDVPGAFHATARSAETVANADALRLDIGTEDNGSKSAGYVFDDPGFDFSTGSFTAETFFKFAGRTKWYAYLFNVADSWAIFLTNNGDNKLGCNVAGTDFIGSESLSDGEWHHLAAVCDAETRTFSVYLDHALFHRFENVADPLKDGQTRTGQLLYGCGAQKTLLGSLSQGGFDELRLTKRALKVTEFLTATPLTDEEALLDVRFEDGWNSCAQGVYAPAVTPSETGAELKRSGRVSREIRRADGQPLHASRQGAVLTGGTVAYEGRGLLDEPAATFEAFVKRTGGTAQDNVVAFTRGTDLAAVYWQLAADGTFAVAGAEAFPSVDLGDGAWHHLAVSHETEAAGVSVTLWWDHVRIATRTVSSAFDFGPGAGLVLGSPGFAGCLDDLRVSVGVLDAGGHQYAAPRTGTVVNIR